MKDKAVSYVIKVLDFLELRRFWSLVLLAVTMLALWFILVHDANVPVEQRLGLEYLTFFGGVFAGVFAWYKVRRENNERSNDKN